MPPVWLAKAPPRPRADFESPCTVHLLELLLYITYMLVYIYYSIICFKLEILLGIPAATCDLALLRCSYISVFKGIAAPCARQIDSIDQLDLKPIHFMPRQSISYRIEVLIDNSRTYCLAVGAIYIKPT